MASQDNTATSRPGNKIHHLVSSLQFCYPYHCRAVLYHIYPGKFLTMWIQKAKSTAEYSPLNKKRINSLYRAERSSQCIWQLLLHTVEEGGMGCLQTTRLQLPLALQCKQSFLLTLISTAKITCKDGDITLSNTGQREREDLLSVVNGDGRTGLEWWAGPASGQLHQGFAALYSPKKFQNTCRHLWKCHCQYSPIKPCAPRWHSIPNAWKVQGITSGKPSLLGQKLYCP